jgi:hypothetical protein
MLEFRLQPALLAGQASVCTPSALPMGEFPRTTAVKRPSLKAELQHYGFAA